MKKGFAIFIFFLFASLFGGINDVNAGWCSSTDQSGQTCFNPTYGTCNCSAGKLQVCCSGGQVVECYWDGGICSGYACYTTVIISSPYCYNLSTPCSCCTPLTTCNCGALATSNQGYGSKTVTCSNSCSTASRTCYCTSACDPYALSCPTTLSNTNQGYGTSSTTWRSCTNTCGSSSTAPCYCKNCTLPIPSGTTTTNTGKQSTDPAYQSTSCSTGPGCTAKSSSLWCTRCTPTACSAPYTSTPTSFGSRTYVCSNTLSSCGYESNTCYCQQPCYLDNCPLDLSNTNLGFGISSLKMTCSNECGLASARSCYCKDCTLPVPVGTTLTDTGKQSTNPVYQTTSCNKGTGCTDKTDDLYCTRCTPSSCTPTYATSNQGYGSVILSCNNALASCGSETRTCYIDACSNCTIPNCPTPLTNTGSSDPNMVLENFRSCTKGAPCGGTPAYASCYETISPQPTIGLAIHPDGANMYGFLSTTHTGIRMANYNLNDPIPMTATYTDVNGATDIEAVSVWFRDASVGGEVQTPLWIDTATNPSQQPSTPNNSSWGFMMRWEGSSWVPYVPSYPASGTAKWVKAIYSSNSFVISGPTGLSMVRVTVPQSDITRSGNIVTMNFELSFNFESENEAVGEVQYQTYLMGNDVFSFTPYDNYDAYPTIQPKIGDYWSDGQLRYRTSPSTPQLYARQWAMTGHNWTIDRHRPLIESLNMSVIGETNLRLNWEVSDEQEIYAIVGNIYAAISMPPETEDLILTESGTVLDINSPFALLTEDEGGEIGVLGSGYAFRKLSIGETDHSGSINIDIQNNKEGSLVIYLAVFDKAGNMTVRSLTYSLGDWIVTEGGFVYSSDGMDFEVKEFIEEATWEGTILAEKGMSPLTADISSEMFADNSISGILPSALVKSDNVNSYHIRPFTINTKLTSLYLELLSAYGDREITGKKDLSGYSPPITQLVGNLNDPSYGCYAEDSVCILKTQGNLTVGSDTTPFICDNWGVFFVSGDLIIKNEIKNINPKKDACIFVVDGSVLIEDGVIASSAGQIQYDEINAYIVSDGAITVEAQTDLSSKYDGVFVEGGLQTLGGLNMNRSLKLVDRNVYPALVVINHPKYSVLSNIVFGSQVDILKTELGFKPY